MTSTSTFTSKATTATTLSNASQLGTVLAGTAPARTSLADWTSGGAGDVGDDNDYYYEGDDGGNDDDGNAARKWTQRGGRKRKKKRLEDRQRMAGRDTYVVDWDELYDPARPTNIEAYLHSDEHIEAAHAWRSVLYAHRREQQKAHGDQQKRRGSGDSSSSGNEGDEGAGTGRRPPQLNSAFAPPASYDLPAATADGTPRPPLQKLSTSPQRPDGLVVSKAPIRFAPAAEADHVMGDGEDDDDDYRPTLSGEAGKNKREEDTELPRTNRPGQAGFAARLMSKYGWTRGSGLGADESGIVNPLRHKKVGKSGTLGRIVGGGGGSNNSSQKPEESTDTKISPVIVLRNMVTGLPDLDVEVADGQLVQDIGEECGAQYGRIERVYIDVPGQLVFIQFTEAVSALRAVNALDGRIFNGNAIVPSFYDADRFEEGIYE